MKKRSAIWVVGIIVLMLLKSESATAQSGISFTGAEVQVYPAGVILGLRTEWMAAEQDGLDLRLGYNIARRGDFGKHDNEEGGGFGISAGYRRYLARWAPGLFVGARTDLWLMEIGWRDETPPEAGTTDITVLQPTLEAGIDLLNPQSSWRIEPAVSFGYEINVDTDGEPVGEGAILLGGLNIGLKL